MATGSNAWKLRRAFLILMVAALAVTGCCSCTGSGGPAGGRSTITVVDGVGRQVAVPQRVERIACLFAFTGHVAVMLGRGKDIVAVVEGLKRDVMLTTICPTVLSAAVPVKQGVVNIEELLRVDPDVVFIDDSTYSSAGEVEKLTKAGLPFLVVRYTTIAEQKETVAMIGKAIGREDEATRFNVFYQRCIDLVQAQVKTIPIAQRVRVYHSVNEATRTDIRGTIPAEWIELAGARNVSLDQDLRLLEGKYFANLEQILLWNPDVILVNEDGVAGYILENPQWAPLQAVKTGRVHQLPNGVSRWGHPNSLETPLAMMWTAKLLYPGLFPSLDINKETTQFYAEYFDYDLSASQVEQILSGAGMRAPK